jgi:hypothetical protein
VAIPAPIMARIVTPDDMMQKGLEHGGFRMWQINSRAQRLLDRSSHGLDQIYCLRTIWEDLLTTKDRRGPHSWVILNIILANSILDYSLTLYMASCCCRRARRWIQLCCSVSVFVLHDGWWCFHLRRLRLVFIKSSPKHKFEDDYDLVVEVFFWSLNSLKLVFWIPLKAFQTMLSESIQTVSESIQTISDVWIHSDDKTVSEWIKTVNFEIQTVNF